MYTKRGALLGYGTWSAFGAGRVLIGLDSGDTDFDTVEETGGSKTVASTGSVAAPVFTGSALGTHSHGVGTLANSSDSPGPPAGTNSTSTVTPLGSVAAPVVSWPAGVPTNTAESSHTHAAGAISWPAGVPTMSGVAIGDHSSHTQTYTQVPNHVHVQSVGTAATGALVGYTYDASTNTSVSSGYSTANPTGGVATGTTNGPGATITHTVSSQGTIAWPAGVPTSAATGAGSSHNHTISWPAGVPTNTAPTFTGQSSTVGAQTFTGSALGTHTHTITGSTEAVTAGTPAGTNSAPAYTGNATSVVQPFVVVYMWLRVS